MSLLLDEGFQCHDDTRAAAGQAALLFIKDNTHARVTLKRYPKDARITVITFILLTDRNAKDTVGQSVDED